jgi:hypothetical protein
MGQLSQIVFGSIENETVELRGHKFEFKKLTTRDIIDGKIDFSIFTKENATTAETLESAVRALAFSVISIDGVKADNVQEMANVLLGLDQSLVIELFGKSDIFGLKNIETQIKN